MINKKTGAHVARNSTNHIKKNQPKKKKLRVVLISLVVVVCILLLGCVGVYAFLNGLYSKLHYQDVASAEEVQKAIENYDPNDYIEAGADIAEGSQIATEEEIEKIQNEMAQQIESGNNAVESNKDILNIMLIGTDARYSSYRSRSDAMILLSINTKDKQISLTSFLRDIYTAIPGCSYNKLNVPYIVAGPSLLFETMKADFGLDLEKYVAVDFVSFVDVIDALGGVDVEISDKEIRAINKNLIEQNEKFGNYYGTDTISTDDAGMVHLNGNQALAYCRIRSLEGADFGRTERQRKVINVLVERAQDLSLTELYKLVEVVLPLVTTNLTQADCASLAMKMVDYSSYDIQMLRIPHDGNFNMVVINGMDVLTVNFKEATAYLNEKIYGIVPAE